MTRRKNSSRNRSGSRSHGGLLHAAAEAGHELSAAVDSLGETWQHVEKAQEKGRAPARVASQATKKAAHTIRGAFGPRRSRRRR